MKKILKIVVLIKIHSLIPIHVEWELILLIKLIINNIIIVKNNSQKREIIIRIICLIDQYKKVDKCTTRVMKTRNKLRYKWI